jgi:hypothetical protein
MKNWILWSTFALLCGAVSLQAQTLPSDVRANHWAAPAIKSVLSNRVMFVEAKQFRGEAKVTRTEAIVFIANLARALETQRWRGAKSVPIPAKAEALADQSDWRTQPVTRYAMARILARAGDYYNNGVRRAAQNSPDRGKSTTIPQRTTVTLNSTHPAFNSVTYLAKLHLIWPSSPLLNPDNKPVTGAEVAVALSQMLVGLNNLHTDTGKELDGSTPDRTFRPKKD